MVSRNIVSTKNQGPRINPPTPPAPPPSPRADSAALRGRAQTARSTPAYTPWTGGGDSRFVTAPGDSTIEYGTNRTQSTGAGPVPGPGPGPVPVIPQTRTPRFEDFDVPDFRDAEYNAQIAALDRALRDFETQAQQRGERYGIDYLQGVRNIGYRPDPGFVAMPNLLEAGQGEAAPSAARSIMGGEEVAPTSGMRGMWDIEGQFDPYSAAARGTRGLRDEFAARGTLRGTDFGQTFGEFQNRLNDQLEAMETGRSRFSEDLAQEIAGQRSGTEERRQAAERAASQRAATAQMNAFLRAMAGS